MEDIPYLIAKYIAYSAWCYFGFRFFRTPSDWTVKSALGLGLVRFCMGIIFGFVIFILVQMFFGRAENSFDTRVLAYIIVFMPVRFVEWLIMTKLIHKTDPHPNALLWVLGGVVISCISDIPYGLQVVPIGRFWC